MLRGSLWLHFIDNVGAQYSLVRGSSSVMSGDVIIGKTWEKVAAVGALLYTDRVASASNPIDGVSRGRTDGPWERLYKARLPVDELAAMLKEG